MATKIKYILPKSSPWLVVIDGETFYVASSVARLLLQLEKAAKKPAAKKPAAKKK